MFHYLFRRVLFTNLYALFAELCLVSAVLSFFQSKFP